VSDIKTICPYCGTGCGLSLRTANGRITQVLPDPSHRVNQEELCLKGYYGFAHVADRERLVTPLKREGQRFTPISWDAALNEIAQRLIGIKSESGPDAFELFSSARERNEENYIAQKFTRTVIGTNNVDHCARLGHSSSSSGLEATVTPAVRSAVVRLHRSLVEGADPDDWPLLCAGLDRTI
jgi:formate dehydrogenase major subunit